MKRIYKLIFKLIIYLITPMSVYYVLPYNAVALTDTDLNYQIKIINKKYNKNRQKYNAFISYLPRDDMVMTVTM